MRSLIKMRPSVFMLLIAFAMNSPVSANTDLKLAVINVGSPAGYKNSEGDIAGIYYDVIKEIAKTANLSAQIDLLPYVRMEKSLEQGKIDCAIFFTTAQRQQTFTQIGLVLKKPLIIALPPKKNNDAKPAFNSLSDFEGMSIGEIRNAKYNQEYIHNDKIFKHQVNNYNSGIKMLKNGRIDGFIGGKDSIDEHYTDDNYDYFVVEIKSSWLQCSKNSPRVTTEVIDKLTLAYNKLAQKNITPNELTNIIRQHSPKYQPID